jgi:hemoglobin/transferrin/lactoferrin receptor protein
MTFLSVLLIAVAVAPQPPAPSEVTGIVRDPSGDVVRGADVKLIAPQQRVAAAARTGEKGTFTLTVGGAGDYLIVISAPGFNDVRSPVKIPTARQLEFTLGLPILHEDVSVTAVMDRVEERTRLAQPVNIVDADEIALRARSAVVQAASEEVGLHVQRTSPVMSGIFVRGLTGNKVNVFVDGVRYSTAAQRGGVNTFLNLIDPALLQSLEVLRGPSSAQYGSDALGGSLQFLSRVPSIGVTNGRRASALLSASVNTADRGLGGNLSGSFAGARFGVFGGVAGRNIGDLRPGDGIDSHAAVTRFLGIRSDRLMPSHLPDTGFDQFGLQASVNWLPGSNDHIVVSYRQGRQNDGKRYDQLLGGDGNLVADLRDLALDLVFGRYERLQAGWLDHVSVTGAVNSQHEERVNQGGNGNPRAAINSEPERTTVSSVQAIARKQLSTVTALAFGGDFHPERITAPSTSLNPVNGVVAVRRGRVPDRATFRSGGVFAQVEYDAVPSKLRLVGNARLNGASYRARASDSPLVNGQSLWPDDQLSASGFAFRGGMTLDTSDAVTVTANVSRGFRAPHITDLGTLGLTGSGFEVAAPDVAGLGGTIGSTADATAISLGLPVEQVGPETSLNYEGGLHIRRSMIRSSVAVFVNNIHDNVVKQSLILPAGAVGRTLGGTPITSQNANGVVFVTAATNPVLVRANFDNARIFGIEHTFGWRPAPRWAAGTTFTYLRAKDTRTGLAPNIEGGTPAPEAYVHVNYTSPTGRWWTGTYIHAAGAQSRLSTLDLADRRTGADRSRTAIRNFFINGATARGWVGSGADGVVGTADDVLTLTGETVTQIQDRVLGAGVNSAPMLPEVAGFVTVGLRGGVRMGRHEVIVDAENLTDENYRGISWGIDAPGRGVSLRYVARF